MNQFRRPKVLIVNNSPIILKVITMLLGREGYVVESIQQPEELEKLDRLDLFSLIILGLNSKTIPNYLSEKYPSTPVVTFYINENKENSWGELLKEVNKKVRPTALKEITRCIGRNGLCWTL